MPNPLDNPEEDRYTRRKRQMMESDQTDTFPSFMPSRTREPENREFRRVHHSPPAQQPTQGILSFQNGNMGIEKPFRNPIDKNDPARLSLASVAEETRRLLPGLLATRPDVTTDSSLCRNEDLDVNKCPKLPQTTVRVVNADTIDAALSIQSQSSLKPVAVLNMANALNPGGAWKTGAKAQEEALCYRTSLSKTLHRKHYPIPKNAVLYAPTVMIIRDSMSDGNNLLDFRDPSQLEVISVISCAAICQPRLKTDARGVESYKFQTDIDLMKDKMRTILRTAIRRKHQQLVLGALGCGAFKNPNYLVVDMWYDVLREQEFQGGYWRDLVFAVFDGNGTHTNYSVFYNKLNGLLV